jgi:small multidrug resistance pump
VKRDNVAWMTGVLMAAALYNVLWGAFVVLFPLALFRFLGMETPNYPEIWQCVGMIVGVYGVGYAVAALDPLRHWPVVLVGLLGKLFGPVGFVSAVAAGDLPLRFGLTLLTNDVIWWFPFALILLHAYRTNHQPRAANA